MTERSFRHQILAYEGPEFWDVLLNFSLPEPHPDEVDIAPLPGRTSIEKFFRCQADDMTTSQVHTLLSVRDYSRAQAEVTAKGYHPVFVDFLALPIAALLLNDPELVERVVDYCDRCFDKGTKITPSRSPVQHETEDLGIYLLAVLERHGWTRTTIAEALKGRPRPRF